MSLFWDYSLIVAPSSTDPGRFEQLLHVFGLDSASIEYAHQPLSLDV